MLCKCLSKNLKEAFRILIKVYEGCLSGSKCISVILFFHFVVLCFFPFFVFSLLDLHFLKYLPPQLQPFMLFGC